MGAEWRIFTDMRSWVKPYFSQRKKLKKNCYALLQGGRRMKWISVKDRLPKRPPSRINENGQKIFKSSDRFIVTDSDGRVFEADYTYCNKSFWNGNSLNEIKVVAYMPLPKPYKPKEEVNENESN